MFTKQKTKYYGDIPTIYILVLQCVTYSCHDAEGPGSSFMEYLSEEWISARKFFSFKINIQNGTIRETWWVFVVIKAFKVSCFSLFFSSDHMELITENVCSIAEFEPGNANQNRTNKYVLHFHALL